MYQFCSEVKKFLGGLEQVSDQIHSPQNSFTEICLVFSTSLLLRSIIQHVVCTSLLKEIPLESNTLHKSAVDKRKSRIGQSLLCGISERTGHQTPIMKRSDSVF